MAHIARGVKNCLWTLVGGISLAGMYVVVAVIVVTSLSVLQLRSAAGTDVSYHDLEVAQARLRAQEALVLEVADAAERGASTFEERLAIYRDTREKIAILRESEPLFQAFALADLTDDSKLFLKWPSLVLIFLVTGMMGVLGSLIAMTWSYVRGDGGLTVRRFILLPFVGGTSAMMVLIFLQAGQLTLTGGGSTDTLDPFVLSFFGIISGLLSERAYEKVSQIGSNIFSVEDRQQRWGIALDEHLQAIGLDVGNLAMHLHTSVEEAERIALGQASASLDQQRVIGALLRRSHREIFTDIPPQEKPAAKERPVGPRGGPVAESSPRKSSDAVATLAAAKN